MHRQVLFLLEEFEESAVQPPVGFPIQAAQVVAGGVIAVIGEFQAGALARRAPLALHTPHTDLVGDQGQAGEFAQGGFVE